MFEKVDVNGNDAHPLYQWLREEKGGVLGDSIKWNFTKFLVGRDGTVIKRYGSTTAPRRSPPTSRRRWLPEPPTPRLTRTAVVLRGNVTARHHRPDREHRCSLP